MATIKENFEIVKNFFEEGNWKYDDSQLDELDGLVISSGISGDNGDIKFDIVFLDEDIIFLSTFPIKFTDDKEYEVLKKISEFNNQVKYGKFCYSFGKKSIYFENIYLTNNIQVNNEILKSLVLGSCLVIDDMFKDIFKLA